MLVTLISTICSMNERRQWTYLYRRKGKKGLSCSKIDQNPMVSVSFSSILFSSFFFSFFPLISGYMNRFEFLFRVSRYSSYVMQKQNTVDVKVSHAIRLFSISYHMTIMWTRTTYERVYHRKNVLIIQTWNGPFLFLKIQKESVNRVFK